MPALLNVVWGEGALRGVRIMCVRDAKSERKTRRERQAKRESGGPKDDRSSSSAFFL